MLAAISGSDIGHCAFMPYSSREFEQNGRHARRRCAGQVRRQPDVMVVEPDEVQASPDIRYGDRGLRLTSRVRL
jgi:hypothetical protein